MSKGGLYGNAPKEAHEHRGAGGNVKKDGLPQVGNKHTSATHGKEFGGLLGESRLHEPNVDYGNHDHNEPGGEEHCSAMNPHGESYAPEE